MPRTAFSTHFRPPATHPPIGLNLGPLCDRSWCETLLFKAFQQQMLRNLIIKLKKTNDKAFSAFNILHRDAYVTTLVWFCYENVTASLWGLIESINRPGLKRFSRNEAKVNEKQHKNEIEYKS